MLHYGPQYRRRVSVMVASFGSVESSIGQLAELSNVAGAFCEAADMVMFDTLDNSIPFPKGYHQPQAIDYHTVVSLASGLPEVFLVSEGLIALAPSILVCVCLGV